MNIALIHSVTDEPRVSMYFSLLTGVTNIILTYKVAEQHLRLGSIYSKACLSFLWFYVWAKEEIQAALSL